MHICVFVVISLISVSLFTELVLFFLCHSLCWACHLLRQTFLRQASLLSSSSPVLTPPRGHSVCRRDALDGFCCELRYSVIPDLAFSSFTRRSRHSPWSLTAMLGYDESHKMQRRPTFFCHPLRLQTFFSSPATLLCYSFHWFFPFFPPPTPSLYLQ